MRRSRGKSAFEREMHEELQFHLDKQIAANIAAGMHLDEAQRQAKAQLGAMEGVKEGCREQRSGFWLESLWADIRYGLRMLHKSPGFTEIVVITLALGIGANTAIFSVVNSILLRPMPVKNPGEIVDLAWQQKNSEPIEYFSYADYKDIRDESAGVFSNIAIFRSNFDGLSTKSRADRVLTSYVTGNFFPMLGLKPAAGRLIEPADGGPVSPDPVIVLAYAYWQAQLGGEEDIIGKTVDLDGKPMKVVGIAPCGFHGTMPFVETQAYLPFSASGYQLANRGWRNVHVLARLRTGVTLAHANSALRVIAQRLATKDPKNDKHFSISAYPETVAQFGPTTGGPLKMVSVLFLALAGIVLLLACVNVASILLARATARQREMALRAALGAARSRLVRQLLTESLLVAMFAGAAGIFAGLWSSVALSRMPLDYGLPLLLDFSFDWRVFVYAFAATTIAGVLVGIVPALRASRQNIDVVLHESASKTVSGRQRMRSALVVAQIAGSLMLLVIAGLFFRSLQQAQHIDLGFNPNHLLNLSMDPHEIGYNDAQSREFYDHLLKRVQLVPGVQSATLAFAIPLRPYTDNADTLSIDGYAPREGQPAPLVHFNIVGPGFFRTIGTPTISGREFSPADDEHSPRVAIINQAMAEKFWRGENPIGRTFALSTSSNAPIRVIGVTGNSHTLSLIGKPSPYFYLPLPQFFMSYETLQLRTVADQRAMISGIEHLIASMAPGLPVFDVETMRESLSGALIAFQFGAVLALALGILGLVLAIVGVYGVTSYAMAQRTHEIGIRLALGAQPGRILRMIFREGGFVIAIGMCIGVLAALAAGRVTGRFLIVRGTDPLTYITVCVVLAIVALAACWIPARRAMRVDPVVALRHE
ncbi:MAG: ADOP family duplicated permease [Candidatus Acidiferrales bacterium]